MKKIVFGLLALASFSAMAEELIPIKSCAGRDADGKSVFVSVNARMQNGSPVTSYVGQLYAIEVKTDNDLVYKVKVAHKSTDNYYTKFSDGSSQFSLNISNDDELGKVGELARLYLKTSNSFGVPIGPIYNTLNMTCSNP